MAFNVNQFAGELKGGGARNSLFQVSIFNPANPIGDFKVPFMCKAAQLPAATVSAVELDYFGRKVKLAGNRTYAEWAPTIINDEDFAIRNAMEQWHNSINTFQGNKREWSGSGYKSTASISQFDKEGGVIREYSFVGLWPSEVAAIDLSWDADTIEEFGVTFQYDYWIVTGGSTGNPGS
jgi:hypothetical protein